MNILILSWRGIGHPKAGGAEVVTFEHAKGWVKAGHKVTLFTSFYKGAQVLDEIDGIKIIRSGGEALGVKFRAALYFLSGAHEKFDLVVDEFHGLPFLTPLYIRSRKLAFIHEVAKEVWRLNPWPKPFNLIPWIIGSSLEPLLFKLFYKNTPFITVSDSTKKDLMEWGIKNKKINVINNGVNSKKIKVIKEDKKTAIFLGALALDKGFPDAVTTFNHIHKKVGNNFQYWVVGKGDKEIVQQQKNVINKLGLQKSIKFWGFVDEDKKFELLSRAHILINPSIREGWGLVVIEAATVGTPTVGYNVPGLRDSIVNRKTGILVNDRTPEHLGDEIIKVLGDKGKYKKMSKNAIAWSKKFSWRKSTEASLKMLERISN